MSFGHHGPVTISRRRALTGIASGCILCSCSRLRAESQLDIPVRDNFTTSNPQVASEWMRQWMNNKKKPVGALHISRFADPVYFLLKPITWEPNASQQGRYNPVVVPVGFVTDFASIPQLFWSALRPDGLYTYAAIVHDYLYWTQTVERIDADEVFKFCMQDFAIDPIVVKALYETVRTFGGSAWSANKRMRLSGEKRILTRFPSDPATRWDEWRKDPAVFQ